MSLEDVKTAVAGVPQEDQDELAAYLVYLRHRRDPGIAAESRARMDDADGRNWLTGDEPVGDESMRVGQTAQPPVPRGWTGTAT